MKNPSDSALMMTPERDLHDLVIRDFRQHGLWLGVNQDGAGRTDLSHRRRLLPEVEVRCDPGLVPSPGRGLA
jgi:hypothetical protein